MAQDIYKFVKSLFEQVESVFISNNLDLICSIATLAIVATAAALVVLAVVRAYKVITSFFVWRR